MAEVFWQDQGEYYFVCKDCHFAFSHEQWTGNTMVRNWDAQRERVYKMALTIKKCQWCGMEIKKDAIT